MLTRIRYGVTAIALFGIGIYFFLWPSVIVVRGLADPALSSSEIPAFVSRWHRSLAPRFEEWAQQRVATRAGELVSQMDVSGTEWPMFATVFFLEATEALADARDRNESAGDADPREYAAGAITAGARLLVDPSNAAWVKRYWGPGYLARENVFYRMLLIRGLTVHQRLSGRLDYVDILRQQAHSLAAEIEAAPFGYLDDYPGESYPVDVIWAVAAIRRADAVLGTDSSAFVDRFFAKITRPVQLGELGLPSYMVDAPSGRPLDDSRGCSTTGLLMQAPFLSPDISSHWYGIYEQHYWQRRAGLAGFTEFPIRDGVDFYADVDAGPVVWGYGLAASSFGLGAARANGRYDHAKPLAGLALVFSWPLPSGELLVPRLFSNATDAPLIGEAGLLFAFSRSPRPGVEVRRGASFPAVVYVALSLYLVLGGTLLAQGASLLRAARHEASPSGRGLFIAWVGAIAVGLCGTLTGSTQIGILAAATATGLGSRRERR